MSVVEEASEQHASLLVFGGHDHNHSLNDVQRFNFSKCGHLAASVKPIKVTITLQFS